MNALVSLRGMKKKKSWDKHDCCENQKKGKKYKKYL